MQKRSACVVVILTLLLGGIPSSIATSHVSNMTSPKNLMADSNRNYSMSEIAADSRGNLHHVSVVTYPFINHEMLVYSLSNSGGEILIAETRIDNVGNLNDTNPILRVDANDVAHIVWVEESAQNSLMYTAIDPYSNGLIFDGNESYDTWISKIDDFRLIQRSELIGNHDFEIDSLGNLHLVWEDYYDPLGLAYNTSNVYYALYNPDFAFGLIDVVIDESMISISPVSSTNPSIALSEDDAPVVVWEQPSQDYPVELVFVADSSGSMYGEWADLCTLLYGGSFVDGSYFEGIKSMFGRFNYTIYETVYGLGNSLPGAASGGNCAAYNQNSGPRSTPLGIIEGDDSGGIRKLSGTVYNGNTYTGPSAEDWGPGTNWACLSWKDSQGNIPGNPPTVDDHKWNPKSTKFILPMSDEGPKDGDLTAADDNLSISEAHSNCVNSNVTPIGLWGQTDTNGQHPDMIQSKMKDLTQCPVSYVSITPRNCNGGTTSTTNAGGRTIDFQEPRSSQSFLPEFLEAIWSELGENVERQIMLKSLDPYNLILNKPSWVNGSSAHSVSAGNYVEDLDKFVHIQNSVLINESTLNMSLANSTFNLAHPNVEFDSQRRLHTSWHQTEWNRLSESKTETLMYALFNTATSRTDGVPEGLNFSGARLLSQPDVIHPAYAKPISQVSKMTLSNEKLHFTWLGADNYSKHQIFYTSQELSEQLSMVSDTVQVTSWDSEKLREGNSPGLSSTNGVAFVSWDDKRNCESNIVSNQSSICHIRFLDKGLDFNFSDTYLEQIEIFPGDSIRIDLTLDTSVFSVPSSTDEQVVVKFLPLQQPWMMSMEYTENATSVQTGDHVLIPAGLKENLTLTISAPSIYDAKQSETVVVNLFSELVDYSHISSEISFDVILTVNSSLTVSSEIGYSSIQQGGIATFPINIQSYSNVVETVNFTTEVITSPGSSSIGVTFTSSEYLGPDELIQRELKVSTLANVVPGNYSITITGATAHTIPTSITSLSVVVEVLPKVQGHLEYTIEPFDEYFESGECRFIKFRVKKLNGDGNLTFSINGAEDKRFSDPRTSWTYDLKSLAIDQSEFRGPWFHQHNQNGEELTIELCAPSIEFPRDEINFQIKSTWVDYGLNLDNASFSMKPYFHSTWNLFEPENLSTFSSVNLSVGVELIDNANSGEVLIEASLSVEGFTLSPEKAEELSEFGKFSSTTLTSPGKAGLILNLTSVVDIGYDKNLSIFVKVSDQRTNTIVEIPVTYFPDMDGDGVPDALDAFPLNVTEWVDSDVDGIGDNADAFPFDSNESMDTDGDGVGDNADAFPNNSSESFDTDGDGLGDNIDFDPFDPTIQYKPEESNGNEETDAVEDVSSMEDIVMYLGITIALLLCIVVILMTVIARKKPSLPEEGLFNITELSEEKWDEPISVPQHSHPSRDLNPNAGISEGYEWLNHNGKMYYRQQNTVRDWVYFERE